MEIDNQASPPPTPLECRAAFNRIVSGETFSSSPQLAAFLRFVVEETLRDGGDRVKAYNIGTQVLKRRHDFDPQIDPIVRVEATRLRRAIERYYSGEGADDPVILEMPRGTYVPAFKFRDIDRLRPVQLPQGTARNFALRRFLLAIAALIFVAGAVTFEINGRSGFITKPADIGRANNTAADTRSFTGVFRSGNGMPNLSVLPLQVSGSDRAGAVFPKALFEKLQFAFTHFDAVNIVDEPLPKADQVDYRLSGFIEYHQDGTASLQFQLLDVLHGTLAWAQAFDNVAWLDNGADTEDRIVTDIAAVLLAPFGVIHARDRALQLTSNEGDPRYRCFLEAVDSIRSFDPTAQIQARACLENLTASRPDFSLGYSLLAQMQIREYLYGIGGLPDDMNTLDTALRLARHAIELAPNSALAHVILMTTYWARHDTAAAIAAGEKAMALNKFDPIILGTNGYFLVLSGRIEQGMRLLRAVPGNDSVRPTWLHFGQFLGSYLTGDLTEAARQADSLVREHYLFTYLARALIDQATGNQAGAKAAMLRLGEIGPGWRTNPRRELTKFISAPEIVDRIGHDLAAASGAVPK